LPTKQRPYLIRAMHEWMLDNGLTPHLVVDATKEGVAVPEGQVSDGRIVFNVSHAATRGLVLGNDDIRFEARFGGVPRSVSIPVGAVLGIYARETGQGMIFGEDDTPRDPATPADPNARPDGGQRRPSLKIIK
jgi:stringent starvation protein B